MSPNIGHLVLKYLCPAVRAVLEDGLKAFVLDVIIGQRKNMPWSVVEASTQLGKSWVHNGDPRLNRGFQRWACDRQLWLPPRPVHQGPAQPLPQSQPVPGAHQPHHALQRLHPRPAQVSAAQPDLPPPPHPTPSLALRPLRKPLPRLRQKGGICRSTARARPPFVPAWLQPLWLHPQPSGTHTNMVFCFYKATVWLIWKLIWFSVSLDVVSPDPLNSSTAPSSEQP